MVGGEMGHWPLQSHHKACFAFLEGLKFSSREPGELELEEESGVPSWSCPRDTDSDWPLTSCCFSGWHEQKESWTPRCLHFYTSYVGSGMSEGTRIASLVVLAKKVFQKSCWWIVYFHMVERLEKLFKLYTTACPTNSLGIEHRISLQASQDMHTKSLAWWEAHILYSVNSTYY